MSVSREVHYTCLKVNRTEEEQSLLEKGAYNLEIGEQASRVILVT